jgi:gamma-glutamyltranspeptidase/glutathione hydrolase
MTKKTRGAIAAGHPKTVQAGVEMLQMGGNAFDAAIAAMLASFVTEPALTSAAGGGFLLAHTTQGQNTLFDFFAQTPQSKRPLNEIDFYPVQVDFGTATQEFHIGMGSIAVPGAIAGVFHIHQRLGHLPLKVVAEPAIRYAKSGIRLSDLQAYCFQILAPILMADEAMKAVIAPEGTLLQAGDVMFMPDFANTLSYLIDNGVREFYEGDIAQMIVQDCQNRGGFLTHDDLKAYQVIERSPFVTTYRHKTLVTNPPPSSGGALIALTLNLLADYHLASVQLGSPEYVSVLAHAMSLTNQVRKDRYGAFLKHEDVMQTFLSPTHLDWYRQQFSEVLAPLNKWGSTTHISTIDADGNAASVTASNGEGAAYVIPSTGIMMNNMLGEADLHPQGFHQWQTHQRISSMMAPTIVLDARQRPEIVLGSGGSNRIRTAILQVLLNLIDFHLSIDEAVSFPRLHWENGTLNLEPGLHHSTLLEAHLPTGTSTVLWERQNLFFGGVHAVARSPQDDFTGAGDQRRGGSFAIVE